MKEDELCSVAAMVTIQGPRVLRLLNCQEDCVLLDVIGFEERVIIEDFRQNSLEAAYELEHGKTSQTFTDEFMAPAQVTIEQHSAESVNIILQDTIIVEPEYMLWIAVGLEDDLPLYDYLFEYIAPLTQNALIVVSLYRRPRTAYQSIREFLDSSSSSTDMNNSFSERSDLRISSSMY
jgi:hypothetical protein